MKRRRVEGWDGGETFTLCRSHLFQIKASGGYPSGAQVRARNTQWAVWGTSSQSTMKPSTAKPSLCELVVTSKAKFQQHCQITRNSFDRIQKFQGWGLHVPSIMGSSAHSSAPRQGIWEKKCQLLGAFPGTRQSALRKQVQLCSATSTRLPNRTQSSGTRVSGKLINQGKGSASKNRGGGQQQDCFHMTIHQRRGAGLWLGGGVRSA